MAWIKIGVDPGVSGAIACVPSHGRNAWVIDMPTKTSKTGKRSVDAEQLAMELRTIVADHLVELAIVEDVHAMPGNGSVSMFGFGRSLGVVEGAMAALGVPIAHISPQTWRKLCGLGSGQKKDASIEMARLRFPECAKYLERQRDSGRAEALLMAYVFC